MEKPNLTIKMPHEAYKKQRAAGGNNVAVALLKTAESWSGGNPYASRYTNSSFIRATEPKYNIDR